MIKGSGHLSPGLFLTAFLKSSLLLTSADAGFWIKYIDLVEYDAVKVIT